MQRNAHSILAEDINSFKELIEKNSKFLICSHENPDADAYGSAAGLGLALRGIGKEVLFINSSPILQRLEFIPSVSETLSKIPDDFQAEVVIFCDCGSKTRVGEDLLAQISLIAKQNIPIVNIDHHISNDLFGTHNIVVSQASSTSELICGLLVETLIPITEQSATALYAGILADSGSFRYSCVRPYTFEAASLCLSKGASSYKIAEQLFSNNSLPQVKLYAKAMLTMSLHLSSKVALITTTKEMVSDCGASISDSDGLAEQGRDIQGVQVSILMKEDKKTDSSSLKSGEAQTLWRVSLRSKSDQIDVSAIAQKFGGGGHRAAAAFRSTKSRQEISAALLAELEKVVNSA